MVQNKSTLIIGLGGAGGNVAQDYFKRKGCSNILLLNTDPAGFEDKPEVPKILLDIGRDERRHFETFFKKAEVVKMIEFSAQRHRKEIFNKIQGYSTIILLLGLGGCTGNTLLAPLATLIKEAKIKCFVIASMPLRYEGKNTSSSALKALSEIKRILPSMNIHTIKLDALVGSNVSVHDFFGQVYYLFEAEIDYVLEHDKLRLTPTEGEPKVFDKYPDDVFG
jgi:cell division GTPase FtsZ